MIVAAGHISIDGNIKRKKLAYTTQLALPIFDYEIADMIKKHLPDLTEGTIVSDISTAAFRRDGDKIILLKR